MRWFVAFLLAAGLALPVAADPANTRFANEARTTRDALGRIVVSATPDDTICTGTLIAPDQVLTAGHCLVDHAKGGWVSPSRVLFQAGRNGARHTLERRVRRILAHPEFVPDIWADVTDTPFQGLLDTLNTDIVVLELARPVPETRIRPMKVSDTAAFAGPVALYGYGASGDDTLKAYAGCLLFFRDADSVSMSCRAEHGVSGAPMLGQHDGEWQVFGVVSVIRHGGFIGTMGPRATGAILSDMRDIRPRETKAFNSGKRSGKTAPKK